MPTKAVLVSCQFAALLWALTCLFVFRVACQAVQHWLPQPWLPGFNEFQGSNLPYPVLLGVQMLIIFLMLRFSLAVQRRTFLPSVQTAKLLMWCGGIYMLGSLLRIGVGLTMPGAPPWFSTWIPAVFHLVLAAYVLTLALYQRLGLEARP